MMTPVFGHSDPISRFLNASKSDRFHHAWLFEGPRGIGKASAAMNLAAHLLGARGRFDGDVFQLERGKVVDHLNAGSHPDFRIISKAGPEGTKPRQDIPVSEMRDLLHFFSLKPAMGGYRVAVIDAVDELNPSGANALLKTLEEPPPNCAIILVYHGKSGLLPTIRSRCQKLVFSRLSDEQTAQILRSSLGDQARLDADLLHLAAGSPGALSGYVHAETDQLMTVLKEVRSKSWPKMSAVHLNRLLKLMSVSDIHLDLFLHFVEDWFSEKVVATNSASEAKRFAMALERMRLETGKAASLNIDLTERSAICLNHFHKLARDSETRNAF